jgi:hypothetical protein
LDLIGVNAVNAKFLHCHVLERLHVDEGGQVGSAHRDGRRELNREGDVVPQRRAGR